MPTFTSSGWLKISILYLTLFLGCKSRFQQTSATLDAEPDSVNTFVDLAPGYSLFDHLFSKANSQNRYSYDIPYPFAKLVDRLREASCQHPDDTTGVMVPYGRSTQKLAADPNFFLFPRLLVTISSAFSPVADHPCKYHLANRIFLGYVQPSRQVEVISYNEISARFEFQVISDYGSQNPKVTYANRALCLSCHQHGGPIFTFSPWSEFNADVKADFGNRNVSRAILAAQPNHNVQLEGINIQDKPTDSPPLQRFDDSVRSAQDLLIMQDVWRHGCGSSEAAWSCRAALVEKLMADGFRKPELVDQFGSGQILAAAWKNSLRPTYPDGYQTFSSVVEDRSPRLPANTLPSRSELIIPKKEIMNLNKELDPKTLRPLTIPLDFDASGDILMLNKRSNVFFTDADLNGLKSKLSDAKGALNFGPLHEALQKIVGENEAHHTDSLSATALRRENLLNDVQGQLTITSGKLKCCEGDLPGLTKVLSMADITAIPSHREPGLQLFFQYCSACHAGKDESSGGTNFLYGKSDDEVQLKIYGLRDKIRNRLVDKEDPMPPAPRDKTLAAQPLDLSEMMKYLEK